MKVSVAMITYNHERYIAQAVESVLMQTADFDFELVIGDDASTDRTPEILQAFAARHPDEIRLIHHSANVGMMSNFVSVLTACKGEYIALLEGDDYWTSPRKLQAQADFLDSHPTYSLCFTTTECRISETGEIAGYLPLTDRPTLAFRDLIKYNQIATASIMVRWGVTGDMPDDYVQLKIGDWPFSLLHLLHGSGGYVPEVMTCYRLHNASTFSSLPVIEQTARALGVYDFIERYAGPDQTVIIREARFKAYLGAAWRLMRHGSRSDAIVYIQRGLKSIPALMWLSAFPFRLIGSAIAYALRRITGRSGQSPFQQHPSNR